MNWGLLGHEWAVELLAGHLRRGEARHAYLLCGPAGIGRRTLALRFAQALNCPQPSPSGQACMRAECRSCRQWMVMQHPDLSLLQPANLGDTIKVDELRGTLAPLSLTPYEAPHRVALLLDFESATDGAQNALLKTLEEAPPSVVLLLTADAPESLLPTVVSRCEVLRLRPVSTERLESWLEAG